MFRAGKPNRDQAGGGIFGRLLRNRRGNTLAIVGAALVPLMAMIGSGVDMSRAYMAKARLQNACDASALAGRRVMIGDTMNDTVRNEAVRYFNFNFPQNLYETESFTPQVSRPAVATVRVTAATKIPTTIMRFFGFSTIDLSVECEASQNYVNTDVMLVLDTTGSMLCKPEEAGTCGRTSEISESRIVALRSAVMALYDALEPTQTQLQAAGMRLRYGLVPYSSSVNVGALIREVNAGYLANSVTYPSRVANYTTAYTQSGQTRYRYTSATYRQQSFDTSQFKLGNAVTIATDDGGYTLTSGSYSPQQLVPAATGESTTSVRWNGCIMERDTVSSINATSGLTIPSGAYDLNINLIPNSDATRWRPMWPEIVHRRTGGSSSTSSGTAIDGLDRGFFACPTAARRLAAWTRGNLQTYVDDLEAVGGTYHDIGMIWGARMISPAGIFADSPSTFNNMPVSRHIIFMTDGELAPNCNSYTAYGVEQNDMRVTNSGSCSDQLARHLQRFRMICNAAKAQNTSIWVIAFGTSLNADMISCASNSEQASVASSRQQLIDRFTQIGQNIGALRLTQ